MCDNICRETKQTRFYSPLQNRQTIRGNNFEPTSGIYSWNIEFGLPKETSFPRRKLESFISQYEDGVGQKFPTQRGQAKWQADAQTV